MSDVKLEALIREFEADQHQRVAAFADRLLEAARAPTVVAKPDPDLITAVEAAVLARRAKSTLATWCRENRMDSEGVHGFSVKAGPRWFVSRSRLLRYLETERK